MAAWVGDDELRRNQVAVAVAASPVHATDDPGGAWQVSTSGQTGLSRAHRAQARQRPAPCGARARVM